MGARGRALRVLGVFGMLHDERSESSVSGNDYWEI
jgi:hypothetical protein